MISTTYQYHEGNVPDATDLPTKSLPQRRR